MKKQTQIQKTYGSLPHAEKISNWKKNLDRLDLVNWERKFDGLNTYTLPDYFKEKYNLDDEAMAHVKRAVQEYNSCWFKLFISKIIDMKIEENKNSKIIIERIRKVR